MVFPADLDFPVVTTYRYLFLIYFFEIAIAHGLFCRD